MVNYTNKQETLDDALRVIESQLEGISARSHVPKMNSEMNMVVHGKKGIQIVEGRELSSIGGMVDDYERVWHEYGGQGSLYENITSPQIEHAATQDVPSAQAKPQLISPFKDTARAVELADDWVLYDKATDTWNNVHRGFKVNLREWLLGDIEQKTRIDLLDDIEQELRAIVSKKVGHYAAGGTNVAGVRAQELKDLERLGGDLRYTRTDFPEGGGYDVYPLKELEKRPPPKRPTVTETVDDVVEEAIQDTTKVRPRSQRIKFLPGEAQRIANQLDPTTGLEAPSLVRDANGRLIFSTHGYESGRVEMGPGVENRSLVNAIDETVDTLTGEHAAALKIKPGETIHANICYPGSQIEGMTRGGNKVVTILGGDYRSTQNVEGDELIVEMMDEQRSARVKAEQAADRAAAESIDIDLDDTVKETKSGKPPPATTKPPKVKAPKAPQKPPISSVDDILKGAGKAKVGAGGLLVAAALVGGTLWGVSSMTNKSKERKRRSNHGTDVSDQASQMHRHL